MAVRHERPASATTTPTRPPMAPPAASMPAVRSAAPARLLAVLRIAMGAVFLWAFVDKTFGLGYSTPAAGAWIHGGSPTAGFLGHLQAGPLRAAFSGLAGSAWADWLFMAGLLGIGLALVLGIGTRVAAVAGGLLLALMWLAEWPPATIGAGGVPTGSTNPVLDDHLIYVLVLVTLAAFRAGDTWGLGRFLPHGSRSSRWLR